MPRRTAFPRRPPTWDPKEDYGKVTLLEEETLTRQTAPSLGRLEGVVKVPIGNRNVRLEIDPELGPKVKHVDGSLRPFVFRWLYREQKVSVDAPKTWLEMSSTEKEVAVYMAAKRNLGLDMLKGPDFWPSLRPGRDEEDEVGMITAAEKQKRLEAEELECRSVRCDREMAREPIVWTPIGLDVVTGNHQKRAPGMIYGLEFPWNEDTLEAMGPEWLTAAFHRAGTLDRDNKVVAVMVEKKIKVTGGNNGGKFLFEVRYRKQTPGLHTKLFAKVPFPCSGPTKSDRLSSSVYKQPMDLEEINAYRLLETKFPVKIPKYYYGDISNETTNFILITERVAFAEVGNKWLKRPPQPFEIEGPYDKCKDFQLRSDAAEYYTLLFRVSARIAGFCKTGRMAPAAVIEKSFRTPRASPSNPEAWGFNTELPTGDDPKTLQRKLETALTFMKTAQVVFPTYVTSATFREKFVETLTTVSAYRNEMDFWKHSDEDYISMAHANLNSDNAYFWRDENGQLDCGVFDWGGLSQTCLGLKLWWIINTADFENTSVNMDSYIHAFVETYEESGGPRLDDEVVKMQMILTAHENALFMVAAVPNCHTMCPQKEWATIRDRHDPRIADNIDGKSTLRTTLHVLNHTVRLLEEMDTDTMVQKWIKDVWVGKWMLTPKSAAAIGLSA